MSGAFPTKPAPETFTPSVCPACRSSQVCTTSKAVSAESYWRCLGCGEVWNVGRRKPFVAPRYGTFGR